MGPSIDAIVDEVMFDFERECRCVCECDCFDDRTEKHNAADELSENQEIKEFESCAVEPKTRKLR